jgi:hypothetical protein
MHIHMRHTKRFMPIRDPRTNEEGPRIEHKEPKGKRERVAKIKRVDRRVPFFFVRFRVFFRNE